MKQKHGALRYLLAALSMLSGATAMASDKQSPPVALPAWQVLEYEQQAFFVTASSKIEIAADSENPQQWRLTANSSVASSSEDVVLDLAAVDGRAIYRSRLSKGKDQRYKVYQFLPQHIVRERRDPPADITTPPCKWPLSSRKEIPYPKAGAGIPVTDAYALLPLAERFLASAGDSSELVINTEFNFYRIRMTRGEDQSIAVNYQEAGVSGPTSGRRQTRAVAIQVSPLGKLTDKPDFSLLGLTSDVTVLFDVTTGLPLQLRGTAPRIGATEINLKAATLRKPAA